MSASPPPPHAPDGVILAHAPGSVTLALDTATPFLTLGLVWPGGERRVSLEVGRAHAEQLPDAVRGLFVASGLPFRADAVVIGTGPGSYTGVRVGASYALGLARVWGAAVRGVSTLEALVRGDGRQGVSLDARRGNVYGAVYDVQGGAVTGMVTPPHKLPLEEFTVRLSGLPHHADAAPDGLALLHAGVGHGLADWQLAYL